MASAKAPPNTIHSRPVSRDSDPFRGMSLTSLLLFLQRTRLGLEGPVQLFAQIEYSLWRIFAGKLVSDLTP